MTSDSSPSLFSEPANWRVAPMLAFESLLASDSYRRTNKSSSQELPKDHTVRSSSAKVYTTMFGRYLKFLGGRNVAFPTATPADIEDFLYLDLAESARSNRQRYARLIERAYSEAVDVGAVASNPVTALLSLMPVAGRAQTTPYQVEPAEIHTLQIWLAERVASILNNQGADVAWREARDITMAAISLGAGLRCAELTALRLPQIKYWAGGPAADRFEFDLPTKASIPTAKPHQTVANPECADAMECWLNFRQRRLPALLKDKDSAMVFPSGLPGKPLETLTLYSNFKELCKAAIAQGALQEQSAWILGTGATGLRRAFIVSSLKQGKDADLLGLRLGHHERRSIRRYTERIASEKNLQRQVF